MVAGGLPAVQVLLDDGTGTYPYDISAYTRLAKGYQLQRGRQDELSDVSPGDLDLTLDNTDGRFTLNSTTIATPSPIKIDQRIRVKETPGGNLLTADQGSFETSTGGFAFSALLGARDLGTSIAQSALHPTDGTNSLLLTWSTTVKGNTALISVPTVIGQTYTLSMDVWVPSGSPDIRATAAFIANGSTISTKNATVRTSVTFTATGTSSSIGVECLSATAGQQCFIDSLALNLGTVAQTFAAGGLTVNRFTGYARSWPVEWPTGSDQFATCSVKVTEAQSRGERWTLRSIPEQEILADLPTAYYTLGEPAVATTAADSSGNQQAALTQAGSGTAVVFGTATGPTTDGLTAATFAAGGMYLAGTLAAATTSIDFWFATSVATTQNLAVPGMTFASGEGVTLVAGNVKVGTLTSPNLVSDGLVHHLEISLSAGTATVTLDNVSLGTTAGVATTSLYLGFDPVQPNKPTFTGSIAHFAAYSTVLSGARITAHYQSGTTGFAGESGTARMTRLAGYASLPVGTLDTSLTNVPFVDTTDASAMSMIQDVADGEMGLTYFDGSGNLTFHNRNRVAAKVAPDVTIDANYLNEGTRFEVDLQGIINHYEVTSQTTGVTQYVDNTASQTTHGKYPSSKTYLVSTDAEALDRGNWTVATHAEPGTRVASLQIDLLTMSAAQQALVLAIEPDTWLQITGLPSQTPGGSTTVDFIVQGLTESVSASPSGAEWSLTLNAANKATVYPTPLILDNATYGLLNTGQLYV